MFGNSSGLEKGGSSEAEVAPIDQVELNIRATIANLKQVYKKDAEGLALFKETCDAIRENDPLLADRIQKEVTGQE